MRRIKAGLFITRATAWRGASPIPRRAATPFGRTAASEPPVPVQEARHGNAGPVTTSIGSRLSEPQRVPTETRVPSKPDASVLSHALRLGEPRSVPTPRSSPTRPPAWLVLATGALA